MCALILKLMILMHAHDLYAEVVFMFACYSCVGFNEEPGKEEVNAEEHLLNCCMIGLLDNVFD